MAAAATEEYPDHMPALPNRRIWLQRTSIGLTTSLFALEAFSHPGTEPSSPVRIAALSSPDRTARLRIHLSHPLDSQPRAGCIRIRPQGDSEWLSLAPLLNRNTGLSRRAHELGWHVLTGRNEIKLPKGVLEYEAFADINSAIVRGTIDPKKNNTLKLQPRNLFEPEDLWMVPGNTHLHLRKMTRPEVNRYLTDIPRADGLKVVFVSYLERATQTKTYISNDYTATDLTALDQPGLRFGNGEEYRHNFGPGAEGYGHVMLLDIAKRILPASVGPGITLAGDDSTPLQPGIRMAREDGATVIWCHNTFGYEDIPNWINGHVDAQNIFDGGNRGSYEDSYYRYLNLGMTVPFSTGTDWFMYDFARTYVPLRPNHDRSPQAWLNMLKRGRSIITNGTWLDLNINESDPGETLDYDQPTTLPIKAHAIGRNDFGRAELIRNGVVVAGADSKRVGDHFEATFKVTHDVKEPEWWSLRIAHPNTGRNELNQPLFAHTSPIYIDYQGKRVFDRKTAQSLIEEMEESMKQIRRFGKFGNIDGQQNVLAIYQRAIKQLRTRQRSAQ